VVGAGSSGGAVPGGWGAGDGLVAVDWVLQPVMAMAATNMTVVMILAGRIATPPNKHDPLWVQDISLAWAGHALTTAKHRGQRETASTWSRSCLETSAPGRSGGSATRSLGSASSGVPVGWSHERPSRGPHGAGSGSACANARGEVLEPRRAAALTCALRPTPGP
jgi:hypothetical protein